MTVDTVVAFLGDWRDSGASVLVFTSDTYGTLWTEKWKWTLSMNIRCLFCFYVQLILDKAGEAIVLNNYKDSEI